MNGRKARERRRRAEQVHTEAPSPVSDVASHPLGPWAGATMEWRRRKDEAMQQIMEANRKALEQCTGEPGCPSSVHDPSCWVGR